MRDLQLSLNQTQKVRLQAALQELEELSSSAASAIVTVADTIPVNHEDGVLKGHGTSELNGEVVATLCGAVARVNKLVYVRPLRARYKPEVGDIIVGRVIEIVPKRWRLEINFRQDAVLMLSAMNTPDGIQRRRTAVDELNMRSIFAENDVVCTELLKFHPCSARVLAVGSLPMSIIRTLAEVRGLQHDGSLQLQARSQKCGKLERGQLLTVSPYLVKRRKQHFHHLEQYGVDLILGCNGFIWVGEHVEAQENTMTEDQESGTEENNKSNEKPMTLEEQERTYTPFETRQNICRIANAVRVLSALGFSLTIEVIVDTAEASTSLKIDVKDMLGAEFYVQMAEREVQRRKSVKKKR